MLFRSKARLGARAEGKITEAFAEDKATVATEDLRLASAIATNLLLTTREAISSAKTRLDALRTLSASARNLS